MRVIVTGGNSGVGKPTAAGLAAAGHSVVIACRTIPKGEQAAAVMTGNVEVRHLDLTDLTGLRAFADSVESVDVLVDNAGVVGLPPTCTAEGFQVHVGTNHLGHFALTCLLGDQMAHVRQKACDPVMARRLWELSVELTSCDWPAPNRRTQRQAVPMEFSIALPNSACVQDRTQPWELHQGEVWCR